MLRSIKYGLYGAVLAGLVGGSVAWSNVDKTVTLQVDGTDQTIHTTASRVRDVLKAAGYQVGPHDIVAPAADAPVHGGATIVYRRGRLLNLTVNGTERRVWTTASTVAEAMGQLGYSSADFTSVSRSQRLPLSPTDIAVRTPMQITLKRGTQVQQITTTDATVAQLLADLGISLGPDDQLSVPATSTLANGQSVIIRHVTRARSSVLVPVPYRTATTQDPGLPKGQTQVVTAGRNGSQRITYALVYVDGKLVGKTPVQTVLVTPPTTRIVHVGTAVAPAPSATGQSNGGQGAGGVPASGGATVAVSASPGSAQAIAQSMLGSYGWGSDQFSCLVTLWDHESGWRVDAANPSGAYGIPQALPGSKMAAAGPNWQTDAATQISWGLGYIAGRYGTPCNAWSDWQGHGGWY